MLLNPSFSFVICVMVLAYVILVGSISWMAWNQEDDGIRGLALYLCVTTIGFVILSSYGQLPTGIVIGCDYIAGALALVFLQYAVLKFLRAKMYWWPFIGMLACLAGAMALTSRSIIAQTAIADGVFTAQYLIIFVTFFRHSTKGPTSGKNVFFAGIFLALIITLWWMYHTMRDPEVLYYSNDASRSQMEMFFASYLVLQLITNGFILMTKERVQTDLKNNLRKDELTGLQTSSWISKDAQRSVEQLKQFALSASLILFDIDYFKDVNNRYDYATGNRVIVQLGALLQQEIRVSHEIYRVRGGKFAVIVPSLNIYQIMNMAENILETVSETLFAEKCEITVSCGISVATTADTWTSWLFRAQHALQKAKAYGRNQIQIEEIDFSNENLPAEISRVGKLHWHPGYTSGHEEIDRQHRALFEQTNTLLQIWVRTDDKKLICKYVAELIANAKTHYDYENEIMHQHTAEFGDSICAHINRHTDLLARAEDLFAQYQRNELTNDALFNFLVFEFVSVHIRDDDGEIAELLDLKNTSTQPEYAVNY